MPVPPSVTTRVVRGTYVSSAGAVQRGTITFRVDQSLIATVESWGVIPTPTVVPLDSSGTFSVSLMASDDIDLFPSGFRYNVQERFQNGYIRTYSIELPSGVDPLDLPSASQFAPGGLGLAIVNSVNGRVGIVQLGALDVGAIPTTQKGAANGVATLDGTGKLTSAQMPAPTAGVSSVDGRTGVVTLADLYATAGHAHAYPVTSVNGSTGAVTLTAASVSAIALSQKGAASGVASLDSSAHLLLAQIPPEAWTDVYDAASQVAMLALPANRSDICRRTDTNRNYMLTGNDPTVLSNWKIFLTPPDAVTTVNGEAGDVSLSAADVSALAVADRGAANGVASLDSGTHVPTAQIPGLDGAKITSGLVNFSRLPTGATSTTVSVGNHAHDYVEHDEVGAVDGVASLDSSGRVPIGQIPPSVGGVNSVNTHTGVVTLIASDVGALSTSTRGAVNGVAALDSGGTVPPVQIPNIDATKITTGTLDVNRLPTGPGPNQVPFGNHTHSYVPTSDRGVASGVATLDVTTKVPLVQLPTGTAADTVALGLHSHSGYVPTTEKGVASGVATLDGTGKVPSGQLPAYPVTSVNALTGAVVLTAADVSAVPTTQKAAANGVATLDAGTLIPLAQIPTGTSGGQVSLGNHQHSRVKTSLVAYVTSGNTNPLPNTSGSWAEVSSSKYRFSVAADSGDLLLISIDMAYDPSGTSQKMDFAILVGSTPIRYASTGTGTPATNGDPALSYGTGQARTTGFMRPFVLQSGDVNSGTFTGTLMTFGPGSSGTIYSSATNPLIVSIINMGPATV